VKPSPNFDNRFGKPRISARILPIALALLLGIIALIYLPAAGHRLLDWDDTTYVTGNPKLADWKAIWTGWSTGYMPLTETIWWLVYQGWGVQPAAYHLANIGFHLLNVLLVFGFLWQLGQGWSGRERDKPFNPWPAWLGAAFFAWHPVQVEAVCWVTSLKDLASALFCLLALNAQVLFIRSSSPASPAGSACRRNRFAWYWAGALAFGLAMLAKPTVIAMAGVAFILSWSFGRGLLRACRDVAPWLLIALFPLAVNVASQAGLYHDYPVPWRYRPLIALDALSFYWGKILWPWELLPAYGRSPRWLIDSGVIWWGWLPAACLLAAAIWRRRRWPGIWLGMCVIVLALLPVLGLRQFAAQNNSTVYDHYLYLGLAGPAIMLAWWLSRRPLPGWGLTLLAAALLGLAAKSAAQVPVWRSDRSLWTWTLQRRPDNEVALVSLGKLAAAEGAYEQAREYYGRALRAAPWSVEAQNNLGAGLAQAGQLEAARGHFEAALKLNPGLLEAHDNLAEYWLLRGRWEEAEPHIRAVLERRPAHVGANSKLAEHLLKTGQPAACVRLLAPLVRPIPGHANLYNLLGVAYGQSGQPLAALTAFQTAVRLDPNNAGAAHNLKQAQPQLPGPAEK
jgi:tetratricopeptide (TPR) repeat protein